MPCPPAHTRFYPIFILPGCLASIIINVGIVVEGSEVIYLSSNAAVPSDGRSSSLLPELLFLHMLSTLKSVVSKMKC